MNLRRSALSALEAQLGYEFKDKTLLDLALTHASVAEGARKIADNERLEFLGDRVLALMVSEALMEAFPDASEGELSRRFHSLVSRETCAEVAKNLGVGPALRLAAGETKSGGRENLTILGDACEALIAAIYIEAGFEGVVRLFKPLWTERMQASGNSVRINPKSYLQEWAASKQKALPKYSIINRSGPDHAPVFTIEVTVDGHPSQSATGRSRQDAEKAAALGFIEREGLA
ncbi:ribonuclease III [Asticcacaulis machinosus]|uniref:Ribonuclease 3 n=1 Tax=Asticcacaulis machinosus TaxID=2984211 RepID=A0ABT5HEQ7_9CAUL|nr:ribonuclease III [Asticcacaulis machinosus]MDC7674736.1 ribonuclease III [Asticcacaulis machinosus]